jgi:hypothetical protein
MRHRSAAERETVISWDCEERVVYITSHDPAVWRRLARLGIEAFKNWHYRDGVESTRFYKLPLARFRWGLKRAGKSLSDDQKAARARVLAASRLANRQRKRTEDDRTHTEVSPEPVETVPDAGGAT